MTDLIPNVALIKFHIVIRRPHGLSLSGTENLVRSYRRDSPDAIKSVPFRDVIKVYLIISSKPHRLILPCSHHLHGQTNCIDLVVVGGVWEVRYFVEKTVDPRAADEDDLAGFGAVGPG